MGRFSRARFTSKAIAEAFMRGINSLLSTALSGMKAAGTMMDVAASNVANVESKGYQAARANLVSAPDGSGVEVGSISRDPSAGVVDENGDELSNVDLPSEMVHLKLGQIL